MSGWYNLIPDQAFDVVPGLPDLPDLPARKHGNDHSTVSVGTAFAQHIAAGKWVYIKILYKKVSI